MLATIGIVEPDLEGEPLHRELVAAIRRVGPGASQGTYLSAVRFAIVSEHLAAGRAFAEAKARYERSVSRRVVEEMAKPREDGRRMSLGWAERIADEAAYEHKLAYLVAEKREQTLRKWLEAIQGALDNFRTARADERAADAAHAQGLTGGA
ncbi:hypothetical protein L332_03415 [Agrococcus pavilionensis RW1]|uniref:Uncharacterized protein n=1 Tax=Agrococcus pavilionensis RW1 TaxID=1330458 RepID=U1LME3_9MICO|nr:hypothetical protein [Agrococcus pavilionensis]ERG63504.1 hypothetical protein L332_03415 [Agrococcus pavilionensis RW1]